MTIRRAPGFSMALVFSFAVMLVLSASNAVAQTQKIDGDSLLDPNRIVDIRIEIKTEDWDVLRRQARNMGAFFSGQAIEDPYDYFPADIWIDGVKVERVGVRKKGLFGSQDQERPSLKVKFDEFVEQDPVEGLSRLTLNNNKQDGSQLSQMLTYRLFTEAGIHAPRCSLAKVTVNGDFLGIYSHVESIKKPFLKRVFGDNSGKLYEGTLTDFHPRTFEKIEAKTAKGEADRETLEQLAESLAAEELDIETLSEIVDLDHFITFWAMESLLRFWDGYASNQNNFYVYESPQDGRLHFIPWGADNSFSSGGPFSRSNGGVTAIYAQSILANRLYRVPGIPERYKAKMEQLLSEVWNEDVLLAEIDRVEEMIGDELHPRQENLARSMDSVRGFIRSRRGEIEGELANWPAEIPSQPRTPQYTVQVGMSEGDFKVEWAPSGGQRTDTPGESDLMIELEGEEVALGAGNAIINDYRPRQMGFGSNRNQGPPTQYQLSFSANREGSDERLTLVLIVDKDVLHESTGEPISVSGMLMQTTGRERQQGSRGGFGGGFGRGGLRTATGHITVEGPIEEGQPFAGQVNVVIQEVRGGFFNQRSQSRNTRPQGTGGGPATGNRPPLQASPLQSALDLNRDGSISADELEKAAESLKRLDANGDGKLSPDELRGRQFSRQPTGRPPSDR